MANFVVNASVLCRYSLLAVVAYVIFTTVFSASQSNKLPTDMAASDAFDAHTEPHNDVTSGQLTFFIIWCGCFVIWLWRYLKGSGQNGHNHKPTNAVETAQEAIKDKQETTTKSDPSIAKSNDKPEVKINIGHDVKQGVDKASNEKKGGEKEVKKFSTANPPPTFDEFLQKVVMFGIIMLYFYLCDYKKIFPMVERAYSRDTFLFVVFLLFLVACCFTLKPTKDIILNRDQTEEWKGWMQVMFVWYHVFAAKEWYNWISTFSALIGSDGGMEGLDAGDVCLVPRVPRVVRTNIHSQDQDQTEEWKGWMQVMFVWYHVFAAKEWYNWIRVYIAAYVWMTGFGNFSFFWVRKDFSLWRFLKMQFRLNFLVTCICVATSNQYMLYYICAMHTYWFITVYIFMGTLQSWNSQPKKMAAKFVAYFLFNALIFEWPLIKDNIFRPFWFVLQYTDPRFTPMHEWVFRASLDHWACFTGMLCAYNYPHFENFIKAVEKGDSAFKKIVPKLIMITVAVVALFVWYTSFMGRDKFSYNESHPYTSIIPIVCFIVLRNAFPVLRQYYANLFTWLGKITLETYLSQLHVYLQSNAKHLIGYIPGYPLLNFALSTIIYLPISYVLFNLTMDFSAYLIPKDMKAVVKNALIAALVFLVPYIAVSCLHVLSQHATHAA